MRAVMRVQEHVLARQQVGPCIALRVLDKRQGPPEVRAHLKSVEDPLGRILLTQQRDGGADQDHRKHGETGQQTPEAKSAGMQLNLGHRLPQPNRRYNTGT